MEGNYQYKSSFRHLIVWQEAKQLTLLVCRLTRNFPTEEKFAIVSQMRRAAYSIIANIAEGNAKLGNKDRCKFINIAQGSLQEIDCFSEIAQELNYLAKHDYEVLVEKVNKVGYLLLKFLESQKQE